MQNVNSRGELSDKMLPSYFLNIKLWIDEYNKQVNHLINMDENVYSKYILTDDFDLKKKEYDETCSSIPLNEKYEKRNIVTNQENMFQEKENIKGVKKNSFIRTPVYIRTLFPFSKKVNYENLQMTEVGLYSISNRHDSSTLTNILNKCILSWGMNSDDITITDATSGIGGNSLSFASVFKKVNSIEWDILQFNALKNNVLEYNYDNVNCYYGDCLRIIPTLNQNIIFLDPPWGGKSYKKEIELTLEIGNIPVVHIINDWKKNCKDLHLVAIKIPKNFSLLEFANNCDFPFMFLLYFRKYNVLILSKQFCKPIAQRHFINYIKSRRKSIG
jgi:16S rRNA G966 N2-methylase RsmD